MNRILTPLLLVAAGAATAQSALPWDLATVLDARTWETRFTSATVERDGALVAVPTGDWVRPELTGHAQAKPPIVVASVEPAGPEVPIPLGRANRGGCPRPPWRPSAGWGS